jgi:uncharacterized protein (DUF2235 family)
MTPKNIVVCCDGTGQKLDARRTNVVRLYRVLDRSDPGQQVDFYHAGIGTLPAAGALTSATRTLSRWAGILGGYGLLDIVAKAYGFIVDHYRPDDRIYLVGFSRGALAVRLVGGLLHRFGVLRPGAKHLIPNALELYERHYTHIANPKQRCQARELDQEFRTLFCMPGGVRIRFLGVWDTVKAFGIFRPRSFPHLRHNESIESVCHAVALDERRRSFMFTSWGGLRGFVEKGPPPGQTVKEVWFAGVHSDVGGGYPEAESGLSWHSFRWMVGEARLAGLRFEDKQLAAVLDAAGERAMRLGEHFFQFHESRTLGWRLLDVLPRRELKNAPERPIPGSGAGLSNADEPADSDLPVPLGWPKRPRTWWPISGRRDINANRREGALLLHRSVEPYLKAGRYHVEDFAFVDDSPVG